MKKFNNMIYFALLLLFILSCSAQQEKTQNASMMQTEQEWDANAKVAD